MIQMIQDFKKKMKVEKRETDSEPAPDNKKEFLISFVICYIALIYNEDHEDYIWFA